MPEDNLKTNEVIINGQVVMTTRGDTVSQNNLLQGESATDKAGEKITGELDPVGKQDFSEFKEEVENQIDAINEDLETKFYSIEDDEGTIDDSDYIPFHDVSDSALPKKKTLFSAIVDKLKSFFATKNGNNITEKDTFRQNINTLEYTGTNIPDNADLDTYKTAGNYRIVSDASGATIAHLPLALCGKVLVFDNGNSGIEQFYLPNHSPRIFVRTVFGNEAWSNWLEVTASDKTHSYEVGTQIASGSDVNTYLTVGSYYIKLDADASNISNIPVSRAGKLIVTQTTDAGTYIFQTFIVNNSYEEYIRYYSPSNYTWSSWKLISTGKHTYEVGTNIPSGSDLNNYTTEGIYFVRTNTDASNISNLPTFSDFARAGKLVVMNINDGSHRQQFYYPYQGATFYQRNYTNSTWTDWKQIATTSDLNNYVSWTQQNILGSKNLFAWNKVNDIFINNNNTGHETTTSHTITDGVITVVNASTSDTHHKGIYVPKNTINPMLEALEGVSITLSCDVKFNTSVTNFRFGMDSGSSNYSVGTDYVHIEKTLTFDSTLANNLIFYIPSTSAYTFYVKNIMIRLASISDNTYEGYAKTNQQLTKTVHTYETGIDIPANSDFNTYTKEGIYQTTSNAIAETISNRPSNVPCRLIVLKTSNDSCKTQLFYGIDSTYYTRHTYNNGSSWSAWKRIATTDLITPSQVGNGYAVATVSGNAITATITGFQLRAGVIVAIYLSSGLTSSCTLNINSTGAKSVKTWVDADPSIGFPLYAGINLLMYDGTYYRLLSNQQSSYIYLQNYVADTSGYLGLQWGYNVNRAQFKYNIANGHLAFNYYKNGYWRGDRELVQNNWSSELILYKETTNSEDGYARISVHIKDTENNKEVTHEIIKFYKDHQASPYDINGLNLVMQSGGHMIIGSGESAQALYGVLTDKTGEKLYLISDDSIFIESNGHTIANRKGITLNTAGNIYPISAETPAVGQGEIGVTDYPFLNFHLSNTVYIERKGWDFKQSNNGVSSDEYIFAICSRDKNSLSNMRVTGGALTNGNTCAQFRLRNFNSSGETVVDGGIDMYANKSGAFWYWVKAPNNFLASLGTGYAYCSTAESTTAKVASMSYYTLAVNGYVTVYFQYNVPANATLNINNQGAKPIYWRSNAIGANIIRAGDKATFIYYDNKYQLLSLDRDITNGVSTYIYSSSSSGAVIHLKGVQTLQTFTLAVGTYLVTYREQSNPASTDSIGVAFSSTQKTASNQFSIADGLYHTFARANVLQTIQFTKPINVTASTTFYLQHNWNGSTNLTSAYACLEISRIG